MFLLFWAIFSSFYINLCHLRGEKLHGDDVGVTSWFCEIQLNLSWVEKRTNYGKFFNFLCFVASAWTCFFFLFQTGTCFGPVWVFVLTGTIFGLIFNQFSILFAIFSFGSEQISLQWNKLLMFRDQILIPGVNHQFHKVKFKIKREIQKAKV